MCNRYFEYKYKTQYSTLIYNISWEFLRNINSTNNKIYKGVTDELNGLLIDLNNKTEKLDPDMIRKIKRLKYMYLAAYYGIQPSWMQSLWNLKNMISNLKKLNIHHTIKSVLRKFCKNLSSKNKHFKSSFLEQLVENSFNNHENNNDPLAYQHDISFRKYYLNFFLNNSKKFYKSFSFLKDDISRKFYLDIILFKILGPRRVKFLTNNQFYWDALDAEKKMRIEIQENKMSQNEYFYEYNLNYSDQNIRLQTHSFDIIHLFFLKHYHFSRDGIKIEPETGDYVLDLGACCGDAALAFATDVGEEGRVFAFDFLPNHIQLMKNNFKKNEQLEKRIKIIPYGVGGKTRNLDKTLEQKGDFINPAASISFNNTEFADVPIISIDDFMERYDVKKVDFIKMDIEGAELESLVGAQKTIMKFKPKLAISIYHKDDDFIKIPQFIKKMSSNYDLYIDHYTIGLYETVLYAIYKT
jgi:FkbM family methyltransferase